MAAGSQGRRGRRARDVSERGHESVHDGPMMR